MKKEIIYEDLSSVGQYGEENLENLFRTLYISLQHASATS